MRFEFWYQIVAETNKLLPKNKENKFVVKDFRSTPE